MLKLTPVSYKKLQKIFEQEGFRFDRQSGDHLIYVKNDVARAVVIPMYKNIPVFIIQNNLRTAGMSREKYFQLLSKL